MLVALKVRLWGVPGARRAYRFARRLVGGGRKMLLSTQRLIMGAWLTLVFYTVLTPIAVIRRLLGKRLPPPELQRGWQKINQRSSDQEMFLRRF